MSANHLLVELDHQPIELCKLLKVANLVGGGGEAKIVISQGYVLLNGEVEYQKRKKIYHEDIIEFNGDLLEVIVNEDLTYDVNADSTTDEDTVKSYPSEEPFYDSKPPATQPRSKQRKPNKKQVAKKTQNKTTDKNKPAESITEPGVRKRKPISF